MLEYIYSYTIEKKSPAYFFVTKEGHLEKWGGELSTFGIDHLKKGQSLENKLFFMSGLFPLTEEYLFLPCIKVENRLSMDVHIFSGENGYWILLLDATMEEKRQILVQQNTNELNLLRHIMSSTGQGYIINKNLEQQIPELLQLSEKGQTRYITILCTRLINLSSDRSLEPQFLFTALQQYIATMTRSINEEGGIVYEIFGDTLISLFGLEPAIESSALHALRSVFTMFKDFKEYYKAENKYNLTSYALTSAIVSGNVDLGVIHVNKQKIFNIFGEPVNLSLILKQAARPYQILIDLNTFEKTQKFNEKFRKIILELPGVQESMPFFLCEVV